MILKKRKQIMEPFWIDKNNKHFKSSEITDRYLLNIITYISKGGGYLYFLSHNVIDDIYDEAIIRGLKPNSRRSELKRKYEQRVADCNWAIEEELSNEFSHGQE